MLNHIAGQPAPFDIDPDFAVIAYAIGLAAVACLTFALAPALHVTRAGAMALLKQTMPKRSGILLRSVLLAIQVAVTVVLLTSAGLLLRGVVQARAMDPGFRVDGLAIAKIELPEEAYDITRATVFLRELTEGLGDAGLRPFGFTSTEPFGETSRFVGVRLAGEGKERTQNIEWMSVSPEYFEALRIPMTEGRAFVASDAQGAIVNETLARRYWNGRNAVGQSVIVGGNRPVQVVGVVKDTFIDGLDDVSPLLFLPLERAQADDSPRLLFDADERETAAAVMRLVGQLDRRARVEIEPLSDRRNEQLADLAMAPLAASVLGPLRVEQVPVAVERIAVEQQDVGEPAGFERAELARREAQCSNVTGGDVASVESRGQKSITGQATARTGRTFNSCATRATNKKDESLHS